MMLTALFAVAFPLATGTACCPAGTELTMSEPHVEAEQARNLNVLVFSKTAGFRHDSIPAGHQMWRQLAERNGFRVQASEDSNLFTPERLKDFDAVVFLNTTGDILNEEQQRALQGFIRAKKGFIGIHAAADTEYGWPWYGQLVGAYFKSHPHIQPADVTVDTNHPTTAMLPRNWRRNDEWYCYRSAPSPSVRILGRLQESSYQGGTMGANHPIMWCHEFDGGRAWYTGMGHTQETYGEPLFQANALAALIWVTRRNP
jgi:type 1 glutamine amidotransferase